MPSVAAKKRYAEAHPDKCKASQASYRARNRGKVTAAVTKFRAENPVKYREQRRKSIWKWRGMPTPTRPEPAVCENCSKPNTKGRRLANDHCHATGIFRGWLCQGCNASIGQLGDSIEGLERAITYLRRSQQ